MEKVGAVVGGNIWQCIVGKVKNTKEKNLGEHFGNTNDDNRNKYYEKVKSKNKKTE